MLSAICMLHQHRKCALFIVTTIRQGSNNDATTLELPDQAGACSWCLQAEWVSPALQACLPWSCDDQQQQYCQLLHSMLSRDRAAAAVELLRKTAAAEATASRPDCAGRSVSIGPRQVPQPLVIMADAGRLDARAQHLACMQLTACRVPVPGAADCVALLVEHLPIQASAVPPPAHGDMLADRGAAQPPPGSISWQLLSVVFNTLPLAVTVVSSSNGRVVFANQASWDVNHALLLAASAAEGPFASVTSGSSAPHASGLEHFLDQLLAADEAREGLVQEALHSIMASGHAWTCVCKVAVPAQTLDQMHALGAGAMGEPAFAPSLGPGVDARPMRQLPAIMEASDDVVSSVEHAFAGQQHGGSRAFGAAAPCTAAAAAAGEAPAAAQAAAQQPQQVHLTAGRSRHGSSTSLPDEHFTSLYASASEQSRCLDVPLMWPGSLQGADVRLGLQVKPGETTTWTHA